MLTRDEAIAAAGEGTHDVVVVGGGVSGAAVFRELSERGQRVLLVDSNDFAAGTSQASGMLVWGGLLYLKNLDFGTVVKLSSARDRMLRTEPDDVHELRFRYLPLLRGGRSRRLVRAALYAYWLLGRRRRRRPYAEREFACSDLVRAERFGGSLVYEEAGLVSSDSRFALNWLLAQQCETSVAINHCALRSGTWERSSSEWRLEVEDRVRGTHTRVRARTLINAAGVWADRVNALCGIESEYRHAFSKGVYLAFDRPQSLDEALVFEMGQHGDSQTFTPWGPVALWGPTETALECLEDGLAPNVEDVRFLLEQANRNLRSRRGPEDIVSLRCGIRPLAVKRDYRATRYPLDLSRRHVVARSKKSAALTLYGGKLTSAPALAREAADVLSDYLVPRPAHVRSEAGPDRPPDAAQAFRFPGVDAHLPDPAWSAQHEASATLEDYMRRRTNLAQWVPRLGLGRGGEHRDAVFAIAQAIHGAEAEGGAAERAITNLEQKAREQDLLLNSV